jgi:hypothetical protein
LSPATVKGAGSIAALYPLGHAEGEETALLRGKLG